MKYALGFWALGFAAGFLGGVGICLLIAAWADKEDD